MSVLRVLAVSAAVVAGTALLAPRAVSIADAADTVHHRGVLVSARPLGGLPAAGVRAELAGAGFGAGSVRYGVDLYRLEYRTVDVRNRPTTASGLLALPRGGERRLRAVSFAHGTASHRDDAPSVSADGWDRGPSLTYASAGFAAVAPDYLGLGTGPGPHPWMDVPSETTASLDLLRAARAFVPRNGRALAREVLVTGFSQGATAALGLAKALQDGADPWFRLRAVAPVSGAYAWREAQLPALVGGRLHPKLSVAYAAYLFVAWDRRHDLYRDPAEVFRAPYATRAAGLFDGTTPGEEMLAALPDRLDALLTPHGLAMLRNPAGRFAAALRTADATCSWAPRVPVRLYGTATDEQAAPANTERCGAAFRAHGAAPALVDVGDTDHLAAHRRATPEIVRWFAALN